MKTTVLTFAASAIALSLGSAAFAQSDNNDSELNALTCANFMAMDDTGMRTLGLKLKSYPGTDIDPNGQMADTSGDTEIPSSAGTNDIPDGNEGDATVLGETEPTGDTEIVDSSGTFDPAAPNAMSDMSDDEVVPYILTACEGQPDTLVTTALRTE